MAGSGLSGDAAQCLATPGTQQAQPAEAQKANKTPPKPLLPVKTTEERAVQ